MAANDIVKNIVLKLKGDTKDIDQIKKRLEDLGKSFSGSTGGNKGLGNLVKDLGRLSKEMEKTGMATTKAFQTITKGAKELADVQLKRASSEFDKMTKKFETSMRRVEQLKASGATGRSMDRAEMIARGRQGQMMSAGNAALEANDVAGSFGPRGPGGFARGAAFIGSVGQGVSDVAGAIRNYSSQQLGYTVQAASPMLNRRRELFAGDMTSSFMNAAYNTDAKSLAYANSQRRMRIAGRLGDAVSDTAQGGLMLAGAGSGAAMGAAAGSIIPGIGTIAGGIIGGGLGYLAAGQGVRSLTSAGSNVADLAMGKGLVAARGADFQEYNQAARDQSMLPTYVSYYQSRAQEFGAAQRGLGQFDDMQFGGLRDAYRSALDPDASRSIAMAMKNRTTIGSKGAIDLAYSAQSAAMKSGMDLESAGGILSTFARRGTGGTESAEKNFFESMSKAFAAGMEDYGLIEGVQTATASILGASQNYVTPSAITQQLVQGFDATRDPGMALQEAIAGREFLNKRLGEGGVIGLQNVSKLSGTLNKYGLGADVGAFSSRLAQDPNSLLDPNSAFYQMYADKLGQKGIQEISNVARQQQVSGAFYDTGMLKADEKSALAKQQRGEDLTTAEAQAYKRGFVRLNPNANDQQIQGAMTSLGNLNKSFTADEQSFSAFAEGTKQSFEGTLAGQMMGAKAKGQGALDKGATAMLSDLGSQASVDFKAQIASLQGFGEEVDMSTEKLSKSLDGLVGAINDATIKIRMSGGVSSAFGAGQVRNK